MRFSSALLGEAYSIRARRWRSLQSSHYARHPGTSGTYGLRTSSHSGQRAPAIASASTDALLLLQSGSGRDVPSTPIPKTAWGQGQAAPSSSAFPRSPAQTAQDTHVSAQPHPRRTTPVHVLPPLSHPPPRLPPTSLHANPDPRGHTLRGMARCCVSDHCVAERGKAETHLLPVKGSTASKISHLPSH